ncbi:MAG: 4-phosphoerythronate dehydrogenase PdxB [Sedimentisphaerales bacterium]|nr:4-phosphoerythronate dehydrogenase PdxB [Sedimentisphaerales bacterium]
MSDTIQTNAMKIIVDENIPFGKELFSSLGEVCCLAGREIFAATVAEARVLLVRSVTRVDQALLDESPVEFVGSATIGTDHIDLEYLKNRGITFTSAAGSNANSVAEYVMTALLTLAQKNGLNLQGRRIGIIGVGNIGSRVETMARGLGLQVLLNDPPLCRQTGDPKFLPLEHVLKADIVTCHVPLTRSGPDPTWHLLDENKLAQLGPDTILINTSRGPVVDNQALKAQLLRRSIGPVILDVWENEPDIDIELLNNVSIGTPHIAGYSQDGKVNGSLMLFHRLCRFLGIKKEIKIKELLPPPENNIIELSASGKSEVEVLTEALSCIYPIMADDGRLRKITRQEPHSRGPFFDQLRKTYPVRREATNYIVKPSENRPALEHMLNLLGFQVR